MKSVKLFGAGLLLVIIAMFLLGFDSPLTGITLLAGMILQFMGCIFWAYKLRWFVPVIIGGTMLTVVYLAVTYIIRILEPTLHPLSEQDEFLIHLISTALGVPGIVFISAGIVSLFQRPRPLSRRYGLPK